jgi:hypothetical protein
MYMVSLGRNGAALVRGVVCAGVIVSIDLTSAKSSSMWIGIIG